MTIDQVWSSSGNDVPAEARTALLADTRAQLRRRRRQRRAFVAFTGAALLSVSGLIALVWTRSGGHVAGAMPAALLLLAQWTALGVFVRDLLRDASSFDATLGLRESLQGLWHDVERTRRRHNMVLALYAAAVPLVAAAILQLREAGRMAPHEAASAAAAFAGVIAAGTLVILGRRYWSLRPRQRRLAALLRQYASD